MPLRLCWHCERRRIVLFGLLLIFVACRKEQSPIPSEETTLFAPDPNAVVKGMYVLNEGNMNANKASLDYVDFVKGTYRRNIYNEINPGVTKGLGDVGNDIGVYGSKLYVVVNNSNKIEVLDASTCKRITQIDLINCRSLAFHEGKVYVSAYLGKPGDPNTPEGLVAEIDTATFSITRQATVGRQPEELLVTKGKLYVANSGGYSPPNYENTISVVDLSSFTEIKRIEVAINLFRLKTDGQGKLYVISRGDYYAIPSRIFKIDTGLDTVIKKYEASASNFWISGSKMFAFSNDWNYDAGKKTPAYATIDLTNDQVEEASFISEDIQKSITVPFGMIVHPISKDIFITDAKDYVTPGTLFCFDSLGTKKWTVTTGDIPGHFAFVY